MKMPSPTEEFDRVSGDSGLLSPESKSLETLGAKPMPAFSNTPPTDPRGYALPIMRTPTSRKFQAIITSDDLIGCNTHFWGGKTVPCEAPDCEACKNGMPFRWHAYCSAVLHPQGLHILYEVTALAAEALVTFRRANSTLRGCAIEAYRWRQNPNGRVIIKCERTSRSLESLPDPPDLIKCLSIIWQIPADAMAKQEHTQFGARIHVEADYPGHKHPIPRGPSDAKQA